MRKGTLFTYIDPHLVERIGSLPATNNAVESLNAQLRVVLREHRGLSLERRVKAAYWWCYMEERLGLARHTFCPITRTSSQAPSSAAKPNTVAAHAAAPSHARASSARWNRSVCRPRGRALAYLDDATILGIFLRTLGPKVCLNSRASLPRDLTAGSGLPRSHRLLPLAGLGRRETD